MNQPTEADIDELLGELDGFDCEEPTFEAPWQARSFALAVGLHTEDELDWRAFQSEFATALEANRGTEAVEETEYRAWLDALEALLTERLSEADVEQRAQEFDSGERDASEFVSGIEHEHT